MRFFHCEDIPAPGGDAVFSKEERRHAFQVVRIRPGETIGLLDGRGGVATAEATHAETARVLSAEKVSEPALKVHLFVCPPRRQKFDQILKQCPEVGVWSVRPFIAARSVSLPKGETAPDRWRGELMEGCKQSRNPFAPKIFEPVSLAAALKMVMAEGWPGFFGDPAGEEFRLAELPESGDAAWFVGPEGGFTDAEADAMRSAGLRPVSLGRWVMRVETAAVVGPAMLLSR